MRGRVPHHCAVLGGFGLPAVNMVAGFSPSFASSTAPHSLTCVCGGQVAAATPGAWCAGYLACTAMLLLPLCLLAACAAHLLLLQSTCQGG